MERFYAIHNTPIYLGRQGENNAREVAFDISHWLESYGAGDVFLAVKRSNETDLYPVPIRMDGSCVLWTVTAADVDVVGHGGECELSYTVGDTVVKSETWQTIVLESMDGDVTEAPIASQAWIDAQRKETAKQQKIADAAAKSAVEAAQSAGIASSKASAAAKSAEQAAEAVKAVADVTAEVNAAKDAAKDAKVSQVAAEKAKDAAQSAAGSAAQDAVAAVDTELAGYVAAAREAQREAETAAEDVAAEVSAAMEGYVAAAQAAQRAAEKARDEAEQAIGGDVATQDYVNEKAATAESNANTYTDQKIAAIPAPDVSGQIEAHNTDAEAHADIRKAASDAATAASTAQDRADAAYSLAEDKEASGTAAAAVGTHNADTAAHSDIRAAIPSKTSQLTNDSGFITGYTETDPTVPAWAKAASKPSYTADEVGAAPASHNHVAGDITSGTLPASRGGTGVTSLDALATAMGAGKVQFGSYIGTGTYGSSNPNSITFNFVPKLIKFFGEVSYKPDGSVNQIVHNSNVSSWCLTEILPTSYTDEVKVIMSTTNAGCWIKKSSDGKTISWCNNTSARDQGNSIGANGYTIKYYYMAIG